MKGVEGTFDVFQHASQGLSKQSYLDAWFDGFPKHAHGEQEHVQAHGENKKRGGETCFHSHADGREVGQGPKDSTLTKHEKVYPIHGL